MIVLGPLCVSADGLFVADEVEVDAHEHGDREDGDDESEEEKETLEMSVSTNRSAYKRAQFLSGRPCRRHRLESRVLGRGVDGAPNEEAFGFPWRGTEVINRRGRVERGLATRALGVWWTIQMSGTARRSVLFGWLVREIAGCSHGSERAICNLEALETHIRLVPIFLRLAQLETRGAFVGGKMGDGALGSLRSDPLIAVELANASFENLRRKISVLKP